MCLNLAQSCLLLTCVNILKCILYSLLHLYPQKQFNCGRKKIFFSLKKTTTTNKLIFKFSSFISLTEYGMLINSFLFGSYIKINLYIVYLESNSEYLKLEYIITLTLSRQKNIKSSVFRRQKYMIP